ncbi:MAG: hypothetical protein ACK4FA_00310, partial [Candidatus Paceibacteria bacterium]
LAEGGATTTFAATTITATDLAILGTATVATSVAVSYYVQNPPADIDFNFRISPDEVVDIHNPGGSGSNTGGRGPRFTPPHMWDEEKFLLVLNLANAGYQGYLRLIADGTPTKVQVQNELGSLYQTDPAFAKVIDQMQKDYDSGKMVAIPVYKPNSLIFDHFIYAFKFEWPKPKIVAPKPGDQQWADGITRIQRGYERAKEGHQTSYDQELLEKFATGDCMGDPNCTRLQEKIVAFLSDEEFLGEIYLNPELLQEFWALMKALDIYKQMPEGEAKQKLKDFLCFRKPSLWICEGQYHLQIEAIPSLIDLEGVPEDIRSTAIVINAALNSVYEEYEAGLITEEALMERVLALEEEAEELMKEYEHELSMVTKLKDPNMDPADDLIQLATKLLDCLSKAEFIKKQLKERKITKSEYDRQAAIIKKEYDKLAKEFRELVKGGYILPDKVWEVVNENAFNSNWANVIIQDINGSRKFGKLKIVLQIYQRVFRGLEEVFIKSGLHNDWRNAPAGKWGTGKVNKVSGATKAPGTETTSSDPNLPKAFVGQNPTSAIDPSQAGSGDWDFIDFNLFIQQLDEKSTDELLRMLVKETSRVRRDAILTVLFRRGIAGEDLSDLFDDGLDITFIIVAGQVYVFVETRGEAQDRIFIDGVEAKEYEGNTAVKITSDGGYQIGQFTVLPDGERNPADELEEQMIFEQRIEEMLEKMGYHRED